MLIDRSVQHVPERECRNIGFPEDDKVGACSFGFGYPLPQPRYRSFAVQEDRRRLHRSSAKVRVGIARHIGSSSVNGPMIKRISPAVELSRRDPQRMAVLWVQEPSNRTTSTIFP